MDHLDLMVLLDLSDQVDLEVRTLLMVQKDPVVQQVQPDHDPLSPLVGLLVLKL